MVKTFGVLTKDENYVDFRTSDFRVFNKKADADAHEAELIKMGLATPGIAKDKNREIQLI